MDLTPMHKRVNALVVHQTKITECAVIEHDDGRLEVIQRGFGAFKRDRRALPQWSLEIAPPEVVVTESTSGYRKSPFAARGGGCLRVGGQRATRQGCARPQDPHGRCTVAGRAGQGWTAAGLRVSFIPPLLMRQLRLVALQRQKPVRKYSAWVASTIPEDGKEFGHSFGQFRGQTGVGGGL